MGASITLAGESLIAQKLADRAGLQIARFVFANIPGLDPTGPVDRSAAKPDAAHIVHTQPIGADQAGYVNPNQVVYSAQMGSDVGDWDFNWIGLESAEDVLFAVAHVPLQQKRRNIPPLQVGNNLTRNFLVVFDGAQALTGITIDANTWQHDFTVRLAGIDERERLSNREVFGRACFFGSALQLEKVGALFYVKAGTAYVEGIRLENPVSQRLPRKSLPTKAWLDVSLQRELSDTVASWKVVFADDCPDYTDSAGVRHYCVALADMVAVSNVIDLRPVEAIDGPLVQHFAARTGDYPKLRARGTTKDDVDLGNLPNAKSDDPTVNDSEILATTAAVNAAMVQVVYPLAGMVASFARKTAPAGWLKANGAAISRTTFAGLFEAIGTTFGAGDGVTTFNIPDMRGEFVRGLDDGRGIDPGRLLGSGQAAMLEAHNHEATTSADGGHVHNATATIDAAGEHTHISPRAANSSVGNGAPNLTTANGWNGTTAASLPAGDHTHTATVTMDVAPSHTHTVTVNKTGGTETRSRNVALLFCIKY